MKRYLPWLIITAVFSVGVGLGAGLWYRSKKAGEELVQPIQPGITKNISPGAQPAHIRGAQSAPVSIEEFGDFQRPPCTALHPELKRIEADYGQRLRVIFLPITQRHPHAFDAARAAEAAAVQGKFWEMHDWLYEQQKVWEKATDARTLFVNQARSLGLDTSRFTADMDSMQVNTRIKLDTERADSLGVSGTPALFLNERPLASITANNIRAAIDATLGSVGDNTRANQNAAR
jgi:protein-disulfide isomerase